MILRNPIGLIGDTLGTFPLLQELSRNGSLYVVPHPDTWPLYELVPEINLLYDAHGSNRLLDIHQAFSLACAQNLYMSQAFHAQLGLNTPTQPLKARLTIQEREVPLYDVVFAPFGRSAPQDQKWAIENWIELAERLPDKRIAVFGNSRYDRPFPPLPNVTNEFDRPIMEVCNILQKAECISIVTGISHLCYHLGVKNTLLTNQGASGWGINPDAIKIENPIPQLKAIELYDLLCQAR